LDSRKLWQAVLGELEVTLSSASYITWFNNTGILTHEDGRLVIGVPNGMARERIIRLYDEAVRESLEHCGVQLKSLEYLVSTQQIQASAMDPLSAAGASTAPTPASAKPGRPNRTSIAPGQTQAPLAPPTHPSLAAGYTFDSFVVGGSNELAYASARAVAQFPGEKYTCLFLYGGVGLGKTHLAQAIGNDIIRRWPNRQVRYVTSEQFTREFTDSIQTKKTKRFADLYRSLDVLIVDDIQFLGNKEKTQEEFFHTFNTLHQLGKQIILSSDKPPKAIPHLEERLRSRFEWGMVADIQRPDLETRAAIVQQKAASQRIKLPVDLVEYLARHYQQSIRELEGALTQLITYCEYHELDPSLAVMKALLGPSATNPRRRSITARTVIEKTAAYFDLHPDDITGTKRDRDIVVPRQIAMYLMREELGLSYPKIAQNVGGRDHTTAMHSCNKIEKALELDEDLRAELNQVKERISL
jgi:chromosomal replication initiator protein